MAKDTNIMKKSVFILLNKYRSKIMGIKILSYFLILFFMITGNLQSETKDFGPEILRIANSSYMIGLGGTAIGSENGIDGLLSNPSYILNANGLEISTMHLMWMTEYNMEYLAGVYPTSSGSFGLGAFYFYLPDDPFINEFGEVTEETLSKNDLGFSLSYANLLFGVPLGVTAKYINHKLIDYNGNSVLFDIGIKQGFIINPGVILIGIGIINIGTGPTFIKEKVSVPFHIPVDIGYKIKSGIAGFGLYSGFNYYSSKEFIGGVGAELSFFNRYKIRTGYRFGYDILGLSLGAGLEHKFKNINVQIDYGFIMGEGLGATHCIQLTAKFSTTGRIWKNQSYYKKIDMKKVLDFFEGDTSVEINDKNKELETKGIEVNIYSAEASSSHDSEPGDACDRNESTRWSSEQQKDPQWIILALRKSEYIKGIKIRWESAAAKRYDIFVSLNKKEWTKIESIDNGESNQERIIAFSQPIKAKYVKIFGKERCGDWGYSIWEVKIYK